MTPNPTIQQRTVITVRAAWGCRVESQFITEQGRINFCNTALHIRSRCKCRRNPDASQERINEETLSRHVHGLLDAHKCELNAELLSIFGNLKLGLPVAKEFELLWDDEKKGWCTKPQPTETEKGEEERDSSVSPGQVSAEVEKPSK